LKASFLARGYDVVMAKSLAFLLVLPLLAFLKTLDHAKDGPREKVDVHLDA
jgi:hypothetical protein